MFKNKFVQMIVDLQKAGVYIYLTNEGYREFLKLMKEDADRFVQENNTVI